MTEVVIAGAVRTPIGKFGGELSSKSAVELGVVAAQAAIDRAGLQPDQVNRAIFGNVYQANNGQNVARQVALNSGMAHSSTAMTVNEVCGSGLQAIHLGAAAIQMGEADVVLVGGTESMSNVPFYAPQMRWGHVLGNAQFTDGLLKDGLLDAFSGHHMVLPRRMLPRSTTLAARTRTALPLHPTKRPSRHRRLVALRPKSCPSPCTRRRVTWW